MFVPLFGFNNINLELEMGVASSYESSPDGLLWTIHLRPGVRWSDGQPFTADDVKFTFDVTFDPNIDNSAKSTFVQADGTYPKVEVVDPETVTFTLREPNALFLDNVGSTYLIARHSLEAAYKSGKFDSAYTVSTPPAEIVGLGPYVLKEYTSQQRVVLERNPYYWKVDSKQQRLPYIDRIIVQIVPDQNTMLSNFQAGTTDMMYTVRPEDVDLLRRDEAAKDFKVYDLGPGYNYQYLVVNQNTSKSPTSGKPFVDPIKSSWFTNVKFRKALSYAIDRDAIIKSVYRGQGVPLYAFIPPANKVWYDDASIVKYPHDLEKAKALLKEIGMEDRDGDGVVEDAKGNKVEFRLGTNSDNSSRVAIATIIKENFKDIGVSVVYQGEPFVSQVQKLAGDARLRRGDRRLAVGEPAGSHPHEEHPALERIRPLLVPLAKDARDRVGGRDRQAPAEESGDARYGGAQEADQRGHPPLVRQPSRDRAPRAELLRFGEESVWKLQAVAACLLHVLEHRRAIPDEVILSRPGWRRRHPGRSAETAMKTFLLRRLLATIPLLLAVTFLTQTLLIVSPGDYITRLRDNPNITPERIAMLKAKYRLDSNNVFVRYGYWVKGVARADFGYSFKFQTSVWSLIGEKIFNTLLLAVAALLISYGFAIPLGVLAAVKKDTIFDRLAGALSFFGLSIPSVFFSLLMVLFAAHTGLFPVSGIHDQVYWDYFTPWQKVTDTIWHLALPASVLGIINTAQFMQQMRGEMVEALSQDYIRTARAKGLSRMKVLYRHALGNAINPIITLFGFSFAFLLSGAFIVEFVFSWPGMGRLTIDALLDKDEPLVMASIVMVTLMLVLGSLVADVLLALVDPRIRLE